MTPPHRTIARINQRSADAALKLAVHAASEGKLCRAAYLALSAVAHAVIQGANEGLAAQDEKRGRAAVETVIGPAKVEPEPHLRTAADKPKAIDGSPLVERFDGRHVVGVAIPGSPGRQVKGGDA